MPSPARSPSSASSAGAVRIGLAVLAAAGAAALVAASFSDVILVRVGGVTRAADTGYDRHGPALILLAVAIVVLAVVALRGSRVAGVGLTVLGVVVILIAVLGDVPDLHRAGAYGALYAAATTAAGSGFYLETLGGVLAVLAGAGLWLTGPTLSRGQRPPSPPRQT